MPQSPYVVVTSAFNEDKYIKHAIESVTAQTVLPLCWTIISDGSTDRTDSIIQSYQERHDFIRYIRVDRTSDQQSPEIGKVAWRKATALAKGISSCSLTDYKYLCCMDADISFGPTTFEMLIKRAEEEAQLGICGGYVYNVINGRLHPLSFSDRNVLGALQFFRRECWIDIGGYVPYGHEDTIALIMARMKGWVTRSYSDTIIKHHKTMSYAGRRRCRAKYRLGMHDYVHGDILSWEMLRCIKEVCDSPLIIGSVLRILGYIKGALANEPILAKEVVAFVHKEQRRLIKNAILRKP